MAIISKRYFWGRKKYNTRTGKFKGEKTYHTDGRVSNWMGKTIKTEKTRGPCG